jgi:DNA modification methylase
MRKPGDNTKPISHTPDEFPVDLWQQYASPVWFDINQSRTLNFKEAREDDDVKHICPLQLDVIERAMNLWSAPDDLVFSPFTGVGSEGYTAIKMGRRFIGCELKPSYYDQAIKNIESAKIGTMDLFS